MSESTPLRDYLVSESPEFQAEVEQGARKLIQQVEDLKAIRRIVGLSQSEPAREIATAPAELSQIERRTLNALRALRLFAQHVGGDLDVAVRLPGYLPIPLDSLADDDATKMSL